MSLSIIQPPRCTCQSQLHLHFLRANPLRCQAAVLAVLPRHPNLVRFIRCEQYGGSDSGGGSVPALVLELCAGGQLSDWLAKQAASGAPVGPAVALAACRQVAAGLGAVGAAGLLHRDVAAHNVLVRREAPLLVKLAGEFKYANNCFVCLCCPNFLALSAPA